MIIENICVGKLVENNLHYLYHIEVKYFLHIF